VRKSAIDHHYNVCGYGSYLDRFDGIFHLKETAFWRKGIHAAIVFAPVEAGIHAARRQKTFPKSGGRRYFIHEERCLVEENTHRCANDSILLSAWKNPLLKTLVCSFDSLLSYYDHS
jgi:hypothetical protein